MNNNISTLQLQIGLPFQYNNVKWHIIKLACSLLNSYLQCRLPKSALVQICTLHGMYSVYSSTFVTSLDLKCELYPTKKWNLIADSISLLNVDIKVE